MNPGSPVRDEKAAEKRKLLTPNRGVSPSRKLLRLKSPRKIGSNDSTSRKRLFGSEKENVDLKVSNV